MANGSLVGPRPPPHGDFNLETQRPRKRLQKPCLKLPSWPSIGTIANNTTKPLKSKASRASRLWDRARTPPAPPSPQKVPPPDLSDAKWADYVEKVHVRCPSTDSSEYHHVSVNIIPEFAHLGLQSLDRRSQTDSQPRSAEPARIRRHAKTPVFRVGQLEGTAARMQHSERKSAEMCALDFDRLNRASACLGPRSAPLPIHRHVHHRSLPALPTRRRSPSDLSSIGSPPPLDRGGQSPTSDTGTLVSFDDETIYFRPTSFCSEPPSPPPVANQYDYRPTPSGPRQTPSPVQSSSPVQTSIGLQICLDLLSRELSTSFEDRASRSSEANFSQLQVWVMIEAYERLREQLHSDVSSHLSPDDVRATESMITTWLRALYTIHDSLTTNTRTNPCDYDFLPSGRFH